MVAVLRVLRVLMVMFLSSVLVDGNAYEHGIRTVPGVLRIGVGLLLIAGIGVLVGLGALLWSIWVREYECGWRYGVHSIDGTDFVKGGIHAAAVIGKGALAIDGAFPDLHLGLRRRGRRLSLRDGYVRPRRRVRCRHSRH